MAATHFTSASSLTGSTQILKNPSLPACGLSSSSFLSTFHSSSGASIRLGLNTGMKIGLSVRAQEETQNKGMPRKMGGQWLSSVTRHVRIYAAYIDPVTEAFDQTQTDKLTLILDPTNEFVWPEDKCQKVYDYFSELVDHYEEVMFLLKEVPFAGEVSAFVQQLGHVIASLQFIVKHPSAGCVFSLLQSDGKVFVESEPLGFAQACLLQDSLIMVGLSTVTQGAPLTEYLLRLIGSDVEHYIRKLLLDGEIKYNLNARVLNFSMGKPRINMDEMDVSMTEDAN